MGRTTPQERAYLVISSAIVAMGLLAALPLVLWLAAPDPFSSEPASVAPPPPSLVTRGRLIDVPGFPAHLRILGRTRLSLHSDGRPLVSEVVPDTDGIFHLEYPTSPGPLTLRVSTLLQVDLFNRTLDRTVVREHPLAAPGPDLGDIPLPRSEEFGSIEYQVVDAAGAVLHPQWVAMDAVKGTSTPDVGIARLDDLEATANAPTEYRRGGRGTILHVPPGEYWLRATVHNRLMLPVKVSVGQGPAAATIKESPSARRIRGIVREMGVGWPLEDVQITVSTINYAGPGSRDPARVVGRTSRTGSYDLPLPDPLPAGGLRLSFVRPGWIGSELDTKEKDFKGGTTLVLDLDLGRN